MRNMINPLYKSYFNRGKIVWLMILFGCLCLSSAQALEWHEEGSLIWPEPPAAPKIYFVKHLNNLKDLNIKKSLFGRLKSLLVGKEEFAFKKPMDIAVDKEGVVYIADIDAASVYIYSPEKRQMRSITEMGPDTRLVSPVGVTVSDEGVIFVSDSYLRKVFALDQKGKPFFTLSEQDGFIRPTGICAHDGKLYVVDTPSNRICVFDARGKLQFQFGRRGNGDGEFNIPTYVAVDHQGWIYVTDTMNFRIQIFDGEGNFLKSIGGAGDASGSFARPKGIAVDSQGHLYTVDGIFDNVQIFDSEGHFLLNFGEPGSGDGQFWLPTGMTIDQDNYIYVADTYNRRVSIFQYRASKGHDG